MSIVKETISISELSNKKQKREFSEEHKKHLSEALKRKWQDPEYRKKGLEILNEIRNTPEWKEAVSKTFKKLWQNPEYREKIRKKASEISKGRKLSEEHKKKISEGLKGHKVSEETKRKLSQAHKGKKLSLETKIKISKSLKGRIPWNKGKKGVYSKETLRKISETGKGRIPWNKGKHNIYSEKTKWEMGKGRRGKSLPKKTRRKLGEITKRNWLNPDFRIKVSNSISKSLKNLWKDPKFREEMLYKMFKAFARRPTKVEKKLIQLINKYNLPFEYVGDGKLIIGGKIPDFIDIKNKKIIEVFGNYWHDKEDEIKRANYFKKYGYDTLIIWQDELNNEQNVLEKINKFIIGGERSEYCQGDNID
jgi:very-short-patch-repair endonuclease